MGDTAAGQTVSLTDGGVETTLIFAEGFELPAFAAFPLLYDQAGQAALGRYFESFLTLAEQTSAPFVIDTPTWRANPDWGEQLGWSAEGLRSANADAVAFVRAQADAHPSVSTLVSGVLGPRGDGYAVTDRMTATEAADYHAPQIDALATAGAERISAMTLTYPEEAIGIVTAAAARGIDVVPSFTVETDGRLPDGSSLTDAIARLDDETGGAALFTMVNCAHPTHILRGLGTDTDRLARIGGVRVNASSLSHAELDEADHLDGGDPVALGRAVAGLRGFLPGVHLLGGCCGTDARHVREIHAAW